MSVTRVDVELAAPKALVAQPRDPSSMTPKERRLEVAALLAVGWRRLQIRRDRLARSESVEAECVHALDGTGAHGDQR